MKKGIAFDVMGATNGAANAVIAAKNFALNNEIIIYLVGDQVEITAILNDEIPSNIKIIHAETTINITDSLDAPAKMPDSSLSLLLNCVDQHNVFAIVSAGSLIHYFTNCMVKFERLKYLQLPGLLLFSFQQNKPIIMADYYINQSLTSSALLDYALIAQQFAQKIVKIPTPKIGLINNGTELDKGLPMIKEAHLKFKDILLLKDYFGLVEAKNYMKYDVNVLVSSGHDSNFILQTNLLFGSIVRNFLEMQAKDPDFEKFSINLKKKMIDKLSFQLNAFALVLGVKFPCLLVHEPANVGDYYLALKYALTISEQQFCGSLDDVLAQVHQPSI